MALNKNDVTIKVSLDGKDVEKDAQAISKSLKEIAEAANKAGGKKPFEGVTKGAEEASKAVGVTKNQALALTYTFNDVAASLATGASPFTILLQQGGQVTQAFGSIGKTLAAIPEILTRYAPAIAGVLGAFAAVKFFNLPNLGAEAAKQINEVGRAAEKASVSVEFLQKMSAATLNVGVSAEDSNKTAAQGLTALREAALNAKDAQKQLTKELEDGKRAQSGGYLTQTDAYKAQVEAADKLKSIFKELRVSVSGFNGDQKSTEALAMNVARALENAYGPRKEELIRALGKVVGDDFAKSLALGRKGIEDAASELTKSADPLTSAQVKLAEEAKTLQEKVKKATELTDQQVSSNLMGADAERSRQALADLEKNKQVVKDVGATAKEAGTQLEEFYKILQGDQQAAADNPTLKKITDIPEGAIDGIREALNIVADIGRSLLDDLTGSTADASANTAQTNASAAGAADGFDRAAQNAGTLAANTEKARQSAQQLEEITNRIANTGGPLAGGGVPQYATGGYVAGPGTGTSDSIPAWLSNGEFVVRAAAVKRFGVDFFRQLNGLSLNPAAFGGRFGFASGGLVGAPSGLSMSSSAGGRSFNLVIDGRSFNGLSGGSDTIASLEKYAALRQLSATSKRAPSRIG